MKQEKEFLRNKFIEFQTRISELNHSIRQQERLFQQKEQEMLVGLLDIMDDFETLENHITAKEETFDKTTKRLTKSMRSIHKKLTRFLKAKDIVKIEFPDNIATIEHCKIIDTRESASQENQSIIAILKNGYMDEKHQKIVRKAEVITVLNE